MDAEPQEDRAEEEHSKMRYFTRPLSGEFVLPPPVNPANCIAQAEIDANQHEWEINHAIEVLAEAKRIRQNPALLAEIRRTIRDRRDLLGMLLDEVGA